MTKEKVDEILLAELQSSVQFLVVEREMADRMVNHFFTLAIASVGGFILILQDGNLKHFEGTYVLLVGAVLIVLGLSAFIRLVKRHLDGMIAEKVRAKIRGEFCRRHSSLKSHYSTMDELNKKIAEPSLSQKVTLFGGAGISIFIVNCFIAAPIVLMNCYGMITSLFETCSVELAVLCWLFEVLIVVGQVSFYFDRKKNITSALETLKPPSGAYDNGTVISLKAIPQSGFEFIGWTGGLRGSTNPATIEMNANKSVTATFKPIKHTLRLSTVGSGIAELSIDPTKQG